jgi:PPP family 3-phenylpropionic acid transporter
VTAQRTYEAICLAGFYTLAFGALGIALPFIPGYFEAAGLSASQIGVLLAVGPACMLFAPPLWGQFADRTGRPGLLLGIATAGAALGYGLMALAGSFAAALGAFVVHAPFASAITTLIDTLALQHVQRRGGSYARLRVFGSLGFVVSSVAFGFSVSSYGRAVLLVPFALMTSAAVWAGGLLARTPRVVHEGPRPTFAAALELLHRRDVSLFLVATALHWVACTPFHGSLALYVRELGLGPRVVSLSAGLAVISEIAVMWTWPRWSSAASPRGLLMLAFGASSVRWALMAWTQRAEVLVLAAVLHALTFGAFYLAAVAWMAARVPDSLRATGQALFVACTFGIGGLVGYLGSGRTYDAVGGATLFTLAAGLEWLPVLALWWLGSPPAAPANNAADRPVGR